MGDWLGKKRMKVLISLAVQMTKVFRENITNLIFVKIDAIYWLFWKAVSWSFNAYQLILNS